MQKLEVFRVRDYSIRRCKWVIEIQPPMRDKLAKHICAIFFQLRFKLGPSNVSVGDKRCILY